MTRLELLRNVTKDISYREFFRNLENSPFGDSSDVMKKPYSKSELVFICISTTARAISQVPLVVSQLNSKGDSKPLPLLHPWNLLFRRPNPYMDRYSFIEAVISFLMLDGDVFIVPFPPASNMPTALYVVRKKYIEPIRNKSTGHLEGWSYNPIISSEGNAPVNKPVPLDVDEVFHVFFWNPDDMILGVSPLVAGEMSIVSDYKAAYYNQVFFDRGAKPSGFLTAEGKLGNTQFQRAKAQFQDENIGYKKMQGLAVLEQGLKFSQTGLTQKDMEFFNLRKTNAERIMQCLGMKKAIISVTEDVNYATSREQRKEWWAGTNLPMMNMFTSAMNFGLYEKFGQIELPTLQVAFDTTTVVALQDSMQEKTVTAYKLFQMGFTPEEIDKRLDMGFGTQPWRKFAYMQTAMGKVNDDGTISANKPTTPPVIPIDNEPIPEKPKRPKAIEKDLDENVQLTHKRILAIAEPLEEIFGSKISRVFFDMRKRTLDIFYTKGRKEVLKETFSEELRKIEILTKPLYQSAIMEGAKSIGVDIDRELIVSPELPEILIFTVNKVLMAQRLLDTVRRHIYKTIEESKDDDSSILADKLRKIFDLAKNRSKIISMTEIGGCINFGRQYSMLRFIPDWKKIWSTKDDDARESHRLLNGTIIPVKERWSNGLVFPGDPFTKNLDEIIGCRCINIPFKEE